MKLPSPVVVDHFGLFRAASWLNHDDDWDPTSQPGFQSIISLLCSGKLYIKLSAPYRVSRNAPTFSDLQPLVKAFVQANSERVLYGSDWPHTQPWDSRIGADPLQPEPFLNVDDEAWIVALKSWMCEEHWYKLWVTNPRTLFA
jgi:predicted TIM-barrel fold metal-dependent hydrolase